jgi:hypothetical protein
MEPQKGYGLVGRGVGGNEVRESRYTSTEKGVCRILEMVQRLENLMEQIYGPSPSTLEALNDMKKESMPQTIEYFIYTFPGVANEISNRLEAIEIRLRDAFV